MSTQFRAFRPLQATRSKTPDGISASTMNLFSPNGTSAVRLCNIGTQTIFIRFLSDGDTGEAGTALSIPIPAGQTEIFTMERGTTGISVFSSAAGSTLYATVGEGI